MKRLGERCGGEHCFKYRKAETRLAIWKHPSSPGKNTGMYSHSLLQGIFLTQGLNQVSCIAGGFFTI